MFVVAALVVSVTSPSPAPTATPQFEVHGYAATVFVSQSTSGLGQVPPEGEAYRNGAPTAPMTPYDYFSDDPVVPGNVGEIVSLGTATWHARKVSYDLGFELVGDNGDLTNSIYWAEPFFGRLDPHEGRSPATFLPYFPTSPGTNETALYGVALPYNAQVRANDGSWRVQAGYVSPASYDRFVFAPPAVLNETPQLGVQTLESLGPGSPWLSNWQVAPSVLPSLGVDAALTRGPFSLEATDALLPQYTGTSARLIGAASVLDRGAFGRYSLDYINVRTSGDVLVVPSIFGTDAMLHPGPQGNLATSNVAGQHQSMLGMRAALHPLAKTDLTVEAGRAWYNAALVGEPGSQAPGNFLHAALLGHLGASATVGADYYYVDPRYGTILLEYGAFENLWGIAWAYPGTWLKSLYSIFDNTASGTNRRALRLRGSAQRGRASVTVNYMTSRQIAPSTVANLEQAGFIEVEFLALQPGAQTLGIIDSFSSYVSWAAPHDTLSLDYVFDAIHRDGPGLDYVATHQPQAVLQDVHHFSNGALAVAGYGWFSDVGTWTTTPVADVYHLAYAGVQLNLGPSNQLLAQVRRYGLGGTPSIPLGPLPTFSGTGVIVDDRFNF
jgi:hypothetical protein